MYTFRTSPTIHQTGVVQSKLAFKSLCRYSRWCNSTGPVVSTKNRLDRKKTTCELKSSVELATVSDNMAAKSVKIKVRF